MTGDLVCDCRFQHRRIKSVDTDGDTVVLDDGFTCSWLHCCDPVPHPDFEHPENPAAIDTDSCVRDSVGQEPVSTVALADPAR